MNLATAKLRNLRMSPRKVRLVANLIRGLRVQEALIQLQFSSKKASKPLKKLIESAVSNAVHNHSFDEQTLTIKTIEVNDGKILYRWMPRAFGRATPLRKRMCHITLSLEGKKDESNNPENVKEETEVAEKKEKKKL